MDVKALNRGELVAIAGGILLGISIFLPWYSLGNQYAHLNTCTGPNSSCTGWLSILVMRFVLLAGAAAPLILAWVIIRGHALSWPRGELTAVIALLALTMIVFRGLIDKPGAPPAQISGPAPPRKARRSIPGGADLCSLIARPPITVLGSAPDRCPDTASRSARTSRCRREARSPA